MKLIKNALIPNLKNDDLQKADILFNDKIVEISKNIQTDLAEEIIDLKEKLLLPGVIDAHVHFNDPGYNHHEDFTTGTMAAAFGGVTTVIDMPCTSVPPVTNVSNLKKKLSVIKSKALVDFALWGGIRGNDYSFNFSRIDKLWNQGVVGFKIYTISGMDSFSELTYQQIDEIFSHYQDADLLFAFHAEDKKIIEDALKNVSKDALKKVETYIKTRPIEAEFKAVKEILSLNKNNNIHFVHISSKKAADHILNKKSRFVSFETCPHYLEFTQTDLLKLKGRLKTAPVVKYNEDRDFLRNILQNGKLDFVTTDHAGCDYEKEKELNDFSKVYNGIPGTELMAVYIVSEFYLKGKISIKRTVEILSENQAKRYGLYPLKGSLQLGTDADFTVIDLNSQYFVDERKLHSKGKYSPFVGRTFDCSVYMTVVRGNKVFKNDKIMVKPGYGNWIRRVSG